MVALGVGGSSLWLEDVCASKNRKLWGWGRLEGIPLENGKQFPHSEVVLHDENGALRKPGESTLPSAPLKLPDGCSPLDIADEYVL